MVKPLAERMLVGSGAAALSRSSRRGQLLILAYHNVTPEGAEAAGERSLHVAERNLARQLDLLAETHDVVPLTAASEPLAGTGRPRAAITFDDAYRGAVTAGVSALARRGLPATIFVTPGFVNDGSFWWDALANPITGILDPAVRRQGLETLRGRDADVRAWAAREGLPQREAPAHCRVASEAELLAAAKTPGITLGSHTWSHANLSRLSAGDIREELTRALRWLHEHIPGALEWLAYPYGLASETVVTAAAEAHRAALDIAGGWVSRRTFAERPFHLPRLNVSASLSLDGFALRTAGLLA
jgi:peptidoglycan/xylan/chitin deacetylase (PgdA/CDA1 family)